MMTMMKIKLRRHCDRAMAQKRRDNDVDHVVSCRSSAVAISDAPFRYIHLYSPKTVEICELYSYTKINNMLK